MRSPLRVFMALLLGAFLGYACKRSPFPLLHDIPALIEPLARLFINAIRVCVIPLVTTSLIAGCAVDELRQTRPSRRQIADNHPLSTLSRRLSLRGPSRSLSFTICHTSLATGP